MNKQKLIERISNLDRVYGEKYYVALEDVLDLVKQLDEPEKVKVPQFVADWYEECKDDLEYNIWSYIYNWETKENSDFKNWLDLERNNPMQTLFNMHQFGYTTVEKEKRFRVKVKGICGNHETLNCEKHSKNWLFSDWEENSLYKTEHTQKELEEANFGWVFDCPGIEIKEVEE